MDRRLRTETTMTPERVRQANRVARIHSLRDALDAAREDLESCGQAQLGQALSRVEHYEDRLRDAETG
jgi:hypothetical protein